MLWVGCSAARALPAVGVEHPLTGCIAHFLAAHAPRFGLLGREPGTILLHVLRDVVPALVAMTRYAVRVARAGVLEVIFDLDLETSPTPFLALRHRIRKQLLSVCRLVLISTAHGIVYAPRRYSQIPNAEAMTILLTLQVDETQGQFPDGIFAPVTPP